MSHRCCRWRFVESSKTSLMTHSTGKNRNVITERRTCGIVDAYVVGIGCISIDDIDGTEELFRQVSCAF